MDLKFSFTYGAEVFWLSHPFRCLQDSSFCSSQFCFCTARFVYDRLSANSSCIAEQQILNLFTNVPLRGAVVLQVIRRVEWFPSWYLLPNGDLAVLVCSPGTLILCYVFSPYFLVSHLSVHTLTPSRSMLQVRRASPRAIKQGHVPVGTIPTS